MAGSVHLSILMATNRSNLLACARVAEACYWAGPNVEVIVRDNSGDARKRALLPLLQRENCNIIIAEPCDVLTNISEVMRLAKGEFVFTLSDDDLCFDHAVAALPDLIEQFGKDASVAGITGIYAVETANSSGIFSYQDIESDDVLKRVDGYLRHRGPNVMYYAPVRREIVQRIFAFANSLPFLFSFHDQIICLLYLLSGRFVRLERLLYLHNLGDWEGRDTAERRDLEFYKAAGLDPVMNTLQWLLCAFEGAVLTRNSDIIPDYPFAQRQVMADHWFRTKVSEFLSIKRSTFNSEFEDPAPKIRAWLQASSGHLSFQRLLSEICNVIAPFSMEKAQRYHAFWDAQINKAASGQPQAEGLAAGSAA